MDENTPLPLTRAEEMGEKPVRLVRAAVRIIVLIQESSGRNCLFVRHPVKGLELPGGAIDPGETPLQAALRELNEEAGIQLPGDQSVTLLDIQPLADQRGGWWMDIIYRADVELSRLIFQREAEFSSCWLSLEEIERQVNPRRSSYATVLRLLRTGEA